jgi:predicted nuclease of predicted toxin-antitoxin system
MKFVVDMNLSPAWIDVLIEGGHDAVHWSDVGAPSASDEEIMAWAAGRELVVVTSDLDFGSILAMSRRNQPSVVQLRQGRHDPDSMGLTLLAAIDATADDLLKGAILTVDPSRHRVRLLSLNDHQENSDV